MANIQPRGNNSWFFTVYLGKGPNGRYIRHTKTITMEDQALLKTKKRLQDYLDDEYAKFMQEILSGEYIDPSKLTFLAFVKSGERSTRTSSLKRKPCTLITLHSKITSFPYSATCAWIKLSRFILLITSSKVGAQKDAKSGGLSSGAIQYHHRILRTSLPALYNGRLSKPTQQQA